MNPSRDLCNRTATGPAARCNDIDDAVLLAAVLSPLFAGGRDALLPAELGPRNPHVLLSSCLQVARPLPGVWSGLAPFSQGRVVPQR